VIRLATSVVLARLLAPEIFGIMQVVYSVQNGIALISDIGLGQNIIYNQNAEDPDFYNTAWSLQVVRGVLLWAVFSAVAIPVGRFYQSPMFIGIIPVVAFSFVISGLISTRRFLLQKRMQYNVLTTFETATSFIGSLATVVIAYFSPTVWALVFGSLIAAAVTIIGSYFVLPGARQRFFISRRYAFEIVSFGKWFFFSSIVYFLSTNFDRLYLAKLIPLQLFGVYGIARNFSELLTTLVQRLGSYIIFPFIASHSKITRAELHEQLAPIRLRFIMVVALGLSLFAATADLVITILYDQRYRAAAWMLPVLIVGTWFAILSTINESSLLGVGRPNYSVFGNSAKFGFLVIGLILGVTHYGVLGGVVVVAFSEIFRYFAMLIGQRREQFSFGGQDLIATAAVFGLIGSCEWLRWVLGFGTSFDGLPISLSSMWVTP